ncbi:ATP-grasp domain-containing protein [Kitasatospora cinereorecta]|uniref:ATP-grasp domain-containing protein n=1 Tax=Kitasatospora cinereorecta TaxID=285560 RepID=A0ABW0VCA0_9ACTN
MTAVEQSRLDLAGEVPVLLVKVGGYPLGYGTLGAVRSLGRLGVPVYAMVEDRWTPTAMSRYLTRAFVRPTSGRESPEHVLAIVRDIGRAIGRRCIALPTDDEAAVLLAEHAADLAPTFLLPPVPAALPRRLADKGSMRELCGQFVPVPRGVAVRGTRMDAARAARIIGYPLVLKNLEPFTRLYRPVVPHTTVVQDEHQLLALCRADGNLSVLVEEYLPRESSESWSTHLCCGPGGEPLAVFTGRKLRSYPPAEGSATRACSVPNPELADLAARLCKQLGYSGVADLDWRLDRRDGRYKLVDFNPRTGAQFRLYETVHGVDVARALHLSLTGRAVPQGPQLERYFAAGQLDLLSAATATWQDRHVPSDLRPRRSTERAWLCRDDVVPAAAMAVRFGGQAIRRLAGLARRPLTGARG